MTPGTAPDRRARPSSSLRPTVADAMIRAPTVRSGATTVGQARVDLLDDHVHAVLVVQDGVLVAVVESGDLRSARSDTRAARAGCLDGRTVSPDADLEGARRDLIVRRRRRLAVVDDHGRLLGLLCLKRSGHGFCSDVGVRARAVECGSRG